MNPDVRVTDVLLLVIAVASKFLDDYFRTANRGGGRDPVPEVQLPDPR